LTRAFDLHATSAVLGLYYRRGTLGAADGVVTGAVTRWYSQVEDPQRRGEPRFVSSSVTALSVLEGDATIDTEAGSQEYVGTHTIAFGAPGVVTLEARIGNVARTVHVNVLDPAEIAAIDIRSVPTSTFEDRDVDVDTRAGFHLEPALSVATLQYPDGDAQIALVLTDAAGRTAIGGAGGIQLDLGSVFSVDPFSVDGTPPGMADGIVRLLPRSLGGSTLRVAVGHATASARVEVK
jgi:hypothetical protein